MSNNILIKWYKQNPLRYITHGVVALFLIWITVGLLGIIDTFNSEDKLKPTIVVTGSMEPTIEVNSIVILEKVNISDINIDDIIQFNNKHLGYSVMHRVVGIGKDFVMTKGDNNDRADSFIVTNEDIIGRVVEIHNEFAKPLSAIFGKIDINNFRQSIIRAFIGIIILAVISGGIILGLYYLFELLTINLFWSKFDKSMQQSLNWMDTEITRNEFNKIIEKYKEIQIKSNIFKRLVVWIRFRKYYDILCSQEQKAKKAEKYKNKLLKLCK